MKVILLFVCAIQKSLFNALYEELIKSLRFCYRMINRGYFMAARRYEISLRVLKTRSGHVMFYLLYKHQRNAKPFHFNIFLLRKARCSHSNRDLFTCKDNMLFSHVKISCFRAKAHLVFHWYLYTKIRFCSF